ncbi:hypothetical protein AIS09_25965 [Salmonella enterica]|nr:hypothetical protein [Salmonella enterica]EAX2707433.1 hypothetical protein [Salmonella enterica]
MSAVRECSRQTAKSTRRKSNRIHQLLNSTRNSLAALQPCSLAALQPCSLAALQPCSLAGYKNRNYPDFQSVFSS